MANRASDRYWDNLADQMMLAGTAFSNIGKSVELNKNLATAAAYGRYRERLKRIRWYRNPFTGKFFRRVR